MFVEWHSRAACPTQPHTLPRPSRGQRCGARARAARVAVCAARTHWGFVFGTAKSFPPQGGNLFSPNAHTKSGRPTLTPPAPSLAHTGRERGSSRAPSRSPVPLGLQGAFSQCAAFPCTPPLLGRAWAALFFGGQSPAPHAASPALSRPCSLPWASSSRATASHCAAAAQCRAEGFGGSCGTAPHPCAVFRVRKLKKIVQ